MCALVLFVPGTQLSKPWNFLNKSDRFGEGEGWTLLLFQVNTLSSRPSLSLLCINEIIFYYYIIIIYICMCVPMCVVCVQRPEVDTGYLPQFFSTYIELRWFAEPRVYCFELVWLTSLPPGSHLSVPHVLGLQMGCHTHLPLGSRHQNSSLVPL